MTFKSLAKKATAAALTIGLLTAGAAAPTAKAQTAQEEAEALLALSALSAISSALGPVMDDRAKFEQTSLELMLQVNGYRISKGLFPLHGNADLNLQAQSWASSQARIAKSPQEARPSYGRGYYESVYATRSTVNLPGKAMAAWKLNEDDRRAMLDPRTRTIGTGIAQYNGMSVVVLRII